MKEINELFADNLKYWLAKRQKSQADLHKYLDISPSVASDYCSGRKMPRADKLILIANWLMIELSDLLEDKKREPDELDQLIYSLKDNEQFRLAVSLLHSLTDSQQEKVIEYMQFISK